MYYSNREGAKNSGRKIAGLLSATGKRGKRRPGRLMVDELSGRTRVEVILMSNLSVYSLRTISRPGRRLPILTSGW